jgi:octaprenyl-diphosphate synthase
LEAALPVERGAAGAIEQLQELVADDLVRVNEMLAAHMGSAVPLIPALASHLIASGGKRLRPILTLVAARLCDYRGLQHIRLATCVEFLHTATLLHDDVVDASALRRGVETANRIWGNQASVLVGDFLLSRAFLLMVEVGSLPVLEILSQTARIIAEGEVLQLSASSDCEIGEDTYLEIIASKTAALFAAASRVGAVIGGRPQEQEAALEAYGRNIGIAYQLVDDALDYSARHQKFGKMLGDDFREGKVTLPVVLAYRGGSEEERGFWRRALDPERQRDGDLAQASVLMQKHGALRATIDRARCYSEAAEAALSIFPDRRERRALIDLARFCVERGY